LGKEKEIILYNTNAEIIIIINHMSMFLVTGKVR